MGVLRAGTGGGWGRSRSRMVVRGPRGQEATRIRGVRSSHENRNCQVWIESSVGFVLVSESASSRISFMSQAARIAISETALGACILLPDRQREATLWSGRPAQRGTGWVLIVLLGGMIFVLSTACVGILSKARPLYWPNDSIEWVALICVALTGAIFVPMMLTGVLAILLMFQTTRTTIHVDRDLFECRTARGVFHWTTRIATARIKRVGIAALRSPGNEEGPTNERPARVILAGDAFSEPAGLLRVACAYGVARELAGKLEEQVERLTSQRVNIANLFDPAYGFADVEKAPVDRHVSVERTAEVVRVRQVPGVSVVLQCLRLSGYTAILAAGVAWILASLPADDGLRRVRTFLSGWGLVFTLLALLGAVFALAPTTLVATKTSLILKRHWWWSRRYERSTMKQIGVLRCPGEPGWPNGTLIVWQADGARLKLLSGDVDTLRHVATVLRREMGIERDTEGSVDETLSRWHFRDESSPPEGCKIVLEKTAEGIVMTKPARGWSAGRRLLILIFGLLMVLCLAVLVGLCPPLGRMLGESAWLSGPGALLCLLVGFGIFDESVSCTRIVVDHENVTTITRTGLGTVRRERPMEKIVWVRTWRLIPDSCDRLVMGLKEGGRWNLTMGPPREMRWLATILRKTLGVGSGAAVQECKE